MKRVFLCGIFVFMSTWCLADTVVFSNLDEDGCYTMNSGLFINEYIAQGEKFSPSETVFLDAVKIAYSVGASNDAVVAVNLYQDDGNSLGQVLQSWSIDNAAVDPPVFGSTNSALIELTPSSSSPVMLTEGESYWLVMLSNSSYLSYWNINSIGATGYHYQNSIFVGEEIVDAVVQGAFEVTGTPVPIPGALWLLGSGLIGLAGTRRRLLG